MGKFRNICTEFWPLIYVRNWFSLSIFGISLPIFFKLCMRVDIGKECRVNFDKYVQSYDPCFTLEIDFHSLSLAFLYRFSSNFFI